MPPSVPPGPVRAHVRARQRVPPGACVPRGARGGAAALGTATEAETRLDDEDEGDDDTMMHAGPWTSGPVASEIIVWSVGTWDGVGALVARTCALSAQGLVTNGATAAGAAEMDAGALAFLHRVLTSAPSFAAKLATLDVSASTSPGSPATLLAALAAVVTGATAPGAAWSTLPCGRGEGSRH